MITTEPRQTTTGRGYGTAHQQERERWRPLVDRGETHCHAIHCLETSRWIAPGTPWHLGHNEDRTAWTGPEHPRCNTSDGARRRWANTARPEPAQPRTPADW